MTTPTNSSNKVQLWDQAQFLKEMTSIENKLKKEGHWTNDIKNIFEDIKIFFQNLIHGENKVRGSDTGREWIRMQQELNALTDIIDKESITSNGGVEIKIEDEIKKIKTIVDFFKSKKAHMTHKERKDFTAGTEGINARLDSVASKSKSINSNPRKGTSEKIESTQNLSMMSSKIIPDLKTLTKLSNDLQLMISQLNYTMFIPKDLQDNSTKLKDFVNGTNKQSDEDIKHLLSRLYLDMADLGHKIDKLVSKPGDSRDIKLAPEPMKKRVAEMIKFLEPYF